MTKKKCLLIAMMMLLFVFVFKMSAMPAGGAAMQLTLAGVPVIEDFSGYAGTGFSPTPTADQMNSASWAISGLSGGPLNYGGTATGSFFARGLTSPGTPTNGGIYSLSSNNGLYIQQSSSSFLPGTITLRVLNNTGIPLDQIDLSYDLFSFNDQSRSQTVKFSWSVDDSNYFQISSHSYQSAAVADSSFDSTHSASVIRGINIPVGAYFYMRWTLDELSGVGAGSRDELGLDNISVTGNFSGWTAADGQHQIVLNEFLANNVSAPAIDSLGHHADFIELYNLNVADVDISNYTISNNAAVPYLWQLPPGTIIPANGYTVIWCDSQLSEPDIHSNFRLANTGTIKLLNQVGIFVDSIRYLGAAVDSSFSRIPNGIGAFRNKTKVTAYTANDTFPRTYRPVYVALDSTHVNASESISVADFGFIVTNPDSVPFTFQVLYDTTGATAIRHLDYEFYNTSFSFPISRRDTIGILQDLYVEPTEHFLIRLRDTTGIVHFIDSVLLVNIIDDDVLRVSFQGASLSSPEYIDTVHLIVKLNALDPSPVSIHVAYSTGDATPGVDFKFTDTTINFSALDTVPRALIVQVIDDHTHEVNEQAVFVLSNEVGPAIIDINTFTVFIVDDDTATGMPSVSENDLLAKVFPNPFLDELTVEFQAKAELLQIYSMDGSLLFEQYDIAAGIHHIDSSKWAKGNYVLRLLNSSGRQGKQMLQKQ